MSENGYDESAIHDEDTQIIVVAREHPQAMVLTSRVEDMRFRRDTAVLQFTDANQARTWLKPRARTWDWLEAQGHTGRRLAMIGAHGDWAMWDDGSVIFGDLMGASGSGGTVERVRGDALPHVPRATEAAGQAVAILAQIADHSPLAPRVEPYLAAVRVDRTVEAQAHPPDAKRPTTWHRHTFYDSDDAVVGTLWTVTVMWAGDDPGESVWYSDNRNQSWGWYDQHAPDKEELRRAASDPECAGRYTEHCDECGSRYPVDLCSGSWIGANLGLACSDRCADAMAERGGRHADRYHNWTAPEPGP